MLELLKNAIFRSERDFRLRFGKWNATDLQFGRRIHLFKWSGVVFTTNLSLLFLLGLLLFTLRLRLFPYYYSNLSSVAYWGMAVITTIGFALSIIAHEAIHLNTARLLGDKPHGLFLYIFGTGTPIELTTGTWWGRTRLYLSGVVFSVFLAAILIGLAFLSETNSRGIFVTGILFHLASANLTLSVFQLLPVLPLDGGRFLLSSFSREGTTHRRVLALLYYIGFPIVFTFLATAGYQIFHQRPVLGGWIAIAGLLIFKANFEEYAYLTLRRRLSGSSIRAFMNTMPVAVPCAISLARFSSEFGDRYPYKFFPVVSDDELVGFVRRSSLRRFSQWQLLEGRITDILVPKSDENTIAPNTDAGTALSLMFHTGNSRLLVSEWNRLIGVVSYGDLLKVTNLAPRFSLRTRATA